MRGELEEHYSDIVKAIKKGDPGAVRRDEKIVLLRDDLFRETLRILPTQLATETAKVELEDIYNVFLHVPTQALTIVNRGASLICRSPLSRRPFTLFHIGFVAYVPSHGVEVIDVGVVGNPARSHSIIVRPESACSPSFIFGSQRCNCYDQWMMTQELACEYNCLIEPPNDSQHFEHQIASRFEMGGDGTITSQELGQAFLLIHLASQNGMGSGAQGGRFASELTASAYIRHRGEYTAEQRHSLTMSGGFEALGLTPDPRTLGGGLSYLMPNMVIDLLAPAKQLIILTNNMKKIEALSKMGMGAKRIAINGRYDANCQTETDWRRSEFGHLIEKRANDTTSWKQEFNQIKSQIQNMLG